MAFCTRCMSGILFTALLIVAFGQNEALANREAHTIQLFKADRSRTVPDPYSRHYDIRLAHEGRIKATLYIDDFGAAGVKGYIHFGIKAYKRDQRHVAKDNLASKKVSQSGIHAITSPIDSDALGVSRRYRIYVDNYMNIPARGKLVLEYPGRRGGEEATEPGGQRQAHRKCDLLVTRLALTKDGRVTVGLKNNGPGAVPDQVWSSNQSASVMLFREGRRWGGAAIRVIDPQRRLQPPGGTATYVSNLEVTGPEEITAVVDYGNRVGEANKANNGRVATLGGSGPAPVVPPKGLKPRTLKP